MSLAWSYAQTEAADLLQEITSIETQMLNQKWNENAKPSYIRYKVSSEDWDNNVVKSEVEMYRNKTNLHLFSDQVDIYTDESETFMVLKTQKMVVASLSSKAVTNSMMSDNFLAFRNKFLKSCTVVSNTLIDSTKEIRQLKLTLNKDLEGLMDIKSITYKYDGKNKKVLSTTVLYENSYKLKKMTVTYLDFKEESTYTFQKSRKYVLSSKGKLLEKYKTYELMDDRK